MILKALLLIKNLFLFLVPILIFTTLSSVYAAEPPKITDEYYVEQGYDFELIVDGLFTPASMTFVENDILVIEKNSGKVIHVNSNDYTKNTILDFSVSFGDESGLLGITSIENNVFVYMTESLSGVDVYENTNSRIAIYHFIWNNGVSSDPILIQEFPMSESNAHVGGAMTSDENSIYFVIGDQRQTGKYQNVDETEANSKYVTSSIFKLDIDDNRLEHFATGIRNSFGLAIDPVTGHLWDTENGDNYFDEINLVSPKFNSGWNLVMGPIERFNLDTCEYNHQRGYNTCIDFWFQGTTNLELIGLEKQLMPLFEDFEYSDPEFSFWKTVGVTAIAFPDEYGFGGFADHVFVGDFVNGRIYKFKLNADRTDFIFETPLLQDQGKYSKLGKTNYVLEFDKTEMNSIFENNPDVDFGFREIIFASSIPGGIADIEFHNGEMYIVSIFDGSIFKITPNENVENYSLPQISESIGDIITRGEFYLKDTSIYESDEIKIIYPKSDRTSADIRMAFVPSPLDDLNNRSDVKLHFISGKAPERITAFKNTDNFDIFDRMTSVWSFPRIGENFTDEEIINFVKNQQEAHCNNATMKDDYYTCKNMRYLGTTIAVKNDIKIYTLMSKSENYFYYEPTSRDSVTGEFLTFKKHPVVNLSSWIFDEDKIWIIYSTMFEYELENFLPNHINMINTFEIKKEPKSITVQSTPSLKTIEDTSPEGGGCLIATAAFGSEIAPQVQFLREIRDSKVMSTESGTVFMTGFNQFYYSFSPAVADYERQNPVFKEAVKVTLTPLLTSLTLLNYVDVDTEQEMLGYGIGIIILNIGMYFFVPSIFIISLKRHFHK